MLEPSITAEKSIHPACLIFPTIMHQIYHQILCFIIASHIVERINLIFIRNSCSLAESRGKSTNWKTIWQPCLKHALWLYRSIGHVQYIAQPRVELLRADWSPMHFERLRFPFSNKKSSDLSVREEKCWEIDEIDEGDGLQCTCKRS